MGMAAAEAAYAHAEAWLEALLDYLCCNRAHFAAAINGKAGLNVLPAHPLHLVWMDCWPMDLDAEAMNDFMLTKVRVWIDKGLKFGAEAHGYMRSNLGCPRATVDEAIVRLLAAI